MQGQERFIPRRAFLRGGAGVLGALYGLHTSADVAREELVGERRAGQERERIMSAAVSTRDSLMKFTVYTNERYRPALVHEFMAGKLDKFLEDCAAGKSPRLIFSLPPRHGKQIADSEPVLTPLGWRKHGDLRPGDCVFGPDGAAARVVAVAPPSSEKMVIRFSNGDEVRCHPHHEWFVFDRARQRWRTMETRYIAQRALRHGPAGVRGGRWTLQVPTASAVQFPEAALSLDPYVLGAWLGDGKSDAPLIAHAGTDVEVVEAITACGFSPTRQYVQANTGVHYALFGRGAGLAEALRAAGVFKDKHVPEEYLRSSLAQRLELLAGLVDTDGSVDPDTGRVRYSTCSERLREGVVDLATTLGFRPYVISVEPALSSSGIQGRKTTWQICFQPTMDVPTRIPRKRIARIAEQRRVGIVSVEPCDPEPGRCIQVDRTDGLYLVGRSLIPTHNSELVSRRFPAYTFGRYPDMNIISTSYAADLSSRFNRDVQRIIDSPAYERVFPATKLYSKNIRSSSRGAYMRNSDIFEIVDHHGSYRSAGVGGGISGMGAHVLIIDDPIKDVAEAQSQTIRDSIKDWFSGVAYLRLEPGGGVIVCMTRWHEDDLAGWLIRKGMEELSEDWEEIRFPGIAEGGDVLGRQEGDALDPARYPIEALERIKNTIGTWQFSALYQQRPVPRDASMFKREWFVTRVPACPLNARRARGWDLAASIKKKAKFTAGVRMSIGPDGRVYIEHVVRKRDTPAQIEKLIKATAQGDALVQPGARMRTSIPQDPGQAGLAQVNAYVKLLAGFDVRFSTESGEKGDRALPLSAQAEAGNVVIVQTGNAEADAWIGPFIDELVLFPNGEYTDQGDGASRAYTALLEMPIPDDGILFVDQVGRKDTR